MYITISDFIREWNRESSLTQKVWDTLTDESLKPKVYAEGRALGQIAWHLTTSIPDYLALFGLEINRVKNIENVLSTAKEIAQTFKDVSLHAIEAIEEQWTDESLKQIQEAFGRQESNATILWGLIKHIVHHRGQVIVLMHQAGIKPSVFTNQQKRNGYI